MPMALGLDRHDVCCRLRLEQSPYRGCSGWVPEDVMLTYLNMLMDEGYTVEQVEKTRDDDGHVQYV